MITINQKLIIVMGVGVVLVAGTLGFDWADTLFPSAEAHGVHEQLQSRFVRIENETYNRQIMQTGDIFTVQGQLVSLVDRDLRGWVSIFAEPTDSWKGWKEIYFGGRLHLPVLYSPADSGNGWEVIESVPPGVFDIPGNSIVPYSVSARVLDGYIYHVHTLLYLEEIGPGLGTGVTVVAQGEPITRPAPSDSTTVSGWWWEWVPPTVTKPAPSDSTATAMPSGGASDDISIIRIDLEAEATALAEGYDLRQIANVSSILPDLVTMYEILARDPGKTSISTTYAQYPSDLEFPDHVVLAIQLFDLNVQAVVVLSLVETILSDITLDMVQGWAEFVGFTETGGFDVTDWTMDTLDAAGLGDNAFSYTIGGSIEGQEFHVQQIWFSRDRLVIFVSAMGLSDEDAMAVAAEIDSRVAQVNQPDVPTTSTPIYEGEATQITVDESGDMPIAATVPAAEIRPYSDLRGADLVGADLRGAVIIEADLTGASLRGADLTGASLQHANLTGVDLRDADLTGASLRGADLTGADLRDADLRYATLSNADLVGADLYSADLTGADLYSADLRYANFTGTNFTYVNLTETIVCDTVPFREATQVPCP